MDFLAKVRLRKRLCTLRVCGRKNYRLQDIQLSKNSLASGFGLWALGLIAPALNFFSGLKPKASSLEPKVVENTGLEPVTSWLQTRRSPS